VSSRVRPPGRGGDPGTALMPLVPCWPSLRHGKARRPIKPIGSDCAPTTAWRRPFFGGDVAPGGLQRCLATGQIPLACGHCCGRGSRRHAFWTWGRRRGRHAAWPWGRRRRPAWPVHGGGGGGRLGAWQWRTKRQPVRPGHGGGGGGRLDAWQWRTRRRSARRQAVAEEAAAGVAPTQCSRPHEKEKK
jgi:hypothetical protein